MPLVLSLAQGEEELLNLESFTWRQLRRYSDKLVI